MAYSFRNDLGGRRCVEDEEKKKRYFRLTNKPFRTMSFWTMSGAVWTLAPSTFLFPYSCVCVCKGAR